MLNLLCAGEWSYESLISTFITSKKDEYEGLEFQMGIHLEVLTDEASKICFSVPEMTNT